MQIFDVFRVLEIAIALAGVVIVHYAYKGYTKTGSRSLLFLAVGFMFVTIGSVAAGLLFQLLNFDLVTVETFAALFQLLGSLLIVYSIIGPRR